MGRIVYAADLFCGAGGTSTGLALAAEAMGLDLRLTAVNHWEVAVDTHAANHPWARHMRTALEGLKPSRAVPGGALDLLVASPECTHHSIARGGRPMCDQSRASAWHVLHWCQELYVKNLIMENVPEFTSWGPLGRNGRPMRRKAGHTFQAFVVALKSLGYCVEWKIITCADHGDATTRRRFFLQARRGRRPRFPQQTHAENAHADMFGAKLPPWRAARDIIDWSIPGHSVFLTADDVRAAGLGIRRPLAEKTIARICAGVSRFWGELAEPFLVRLRGSGAGQVSASAMPVSAPVPTLTSGGEHVGLCRPFLVRYNRGDERVYDAGRPVPVIDTNPRYGLLQPLILPQDAEGAIRPVSDAIPTITATGAHALLQPFILATGQTGGGPRTAGLSTPLSTIVSKAEHCLVEPFIVEYYGTGGPVRVDEPLRTVTANDRFGLCRPVAAEIGGRRCLVDILFRMLTPAELAAAHSFPARYLFKGNKAEVVRQIGNSVPVRTAQALCAEALAA